jgi:hypothetical protein
MNTPFRVWGLLNLPSIVNGYVGSGERRELPRQAAPDGGSLILPDPRRLHSYRMKGRLTGKFVMKCSPRSLTISACQDRSEEKIKGLSSKCQARNKDFSLSSPYSGEGIKQPSLGLNRAGHSGESSGSQNEFSFEFEQVLPLL